VPKSSPFRALGLELLALRQARAPVKALLERASAEERLRESVRAVACAQCRAERDTEARARRLRTCDREMALHCATNRPSGRGDHCARARARAARGGEDGGVVASLRPTCFGEELASSAVAFAASPRGDRAFVVFCEPIGHHLLLRAYDATTGALIHEVDLHEAITRRHFHDNSELYEDTTTCCVGKITSLQVHPLKPWALVAFEYALYEEEDDVLIARDGYLSWDAESDAEPRLFFLINSIYRVHMVKNDSIRTRARKKEQKTSKRANAFPRLQQTCWDATTPCDVLLFGSVAFYEPPCRGLSDELGTRVVYHEVPRSGEDLTIRARTPRVEPGICEIDRSAVFQCFTVPMEPRDGVLLDQSKVSFLCSSERTIARFDANDIRGDLSMAFAPAGDTLVVANGWQLYVYSEDQHGWWTLQEIVRMHDQVFKTPSDFVEVHQPRLSMHFSGCGRFVAVDMLSNKPPTRLRTSQLLSLSKKLNGTLAIVDLRRPIARVEAFTGLARRVRVFFACVVAKPYQIALCRDRWVMWTRGGLLFLD